MIMPVITATRFQGISLMSQCRIFPAITFPAAVAVALLGAPFLSGCVTTETRWTHPEIPAEEWGVDAAQCKWEARRKAEREIGDDIQYTSDETYDDAQSIDSMFAREDMDKRARELFARCMKSLGYVPTE